MLGIYGASISSATTLRAFTLNRLPFLISTIAQNTAFNRRGSRPNKLCLRNLHIQNHNPRKDPLQLLQPSHPLSRMSTTKSNPSSATTTTTTNDSNNDHQPPSQPPHNNQIIHFGPFEVTNQVFLTTALSFALVNLKPLLPGHVLVCPLRPAKRLTDLSAAEVTDLFTTVQRVQRMLARYYFGADSCTLGSFNIAVQDGPEAGQTVSHVHVHVIPRIRGSTAKDVETPSDELYDRMADEDGNVGGAQWDRRRRGLEGRPEPGGKFPSIEDSERVARGMEDMEGEAKIYRGVLRELEGGDGR